MVKSISAAASHLSPAGRGRPAGPGEGALRPEAWLPLTRSLTLATSPRRGEVKTSAFPSDGASSGVPAAFFWINLAQRRDRLS